MFTLVIGGVLTPDVVQHIIELALRGMGHLFGIDLSSYPSLVGG